MRFTFRLVDWASSSEVRQAWKELSEKHSLTGDPFQNIEGTFMLADFALLGPFNFSFSLNKVRKFGWNAFVDSAECIRQVIDEFAEMKMVPKIG